jgi:hypothetical protein
MSRKTLLYIAASAELCLAGYFVMAFLAWCAKLYLFSSGHNSFSVILLLWPALAIACFVLYALTRRQAKQLESK